MVDIPPRGRRPVTKRTCTLSQLDSSHVRRTYWWERGGALLKQNLLAMEADSRTEPLLRPQSSQSGFNLVELSRYFSASEVTAVHSFHPPPQLPPFVQKVLSFYYQNQNYSKMSHELIFF